MKRERLTPTELPLFRDLLAGFKINARMTLDGDEVSLLTKYSLRQVTLTPGNSARDRRKSAWYAAPVVLLLGLWLYYATPLSMPATILVAILVFLLLWFSIYQQIREAVRVGDLLDGRDFKARSLIQLLYKEHMIRKMSGVFAIV